MIQIGIPELLVLTLVILFSVKPENIQHYLKNFLKFFVKTQDTLSTTKEELKKELKIEELRQDIFNEQKLKEFAKKEDE
jgi:Sec-independent protein translocase protein TatA|tara:strand:- start:1197 stop:1433 length:237 start_codon:yes stop_codon:yes gene_type:complete